jgi:nucleoside 2-deoxyribosyltransferase
MKIFESGDWAVFGAIIVALTAVVGAFMAMLMRGLRDRSRSEYNEYKQRAELSAMRESFERKLEMVTAQLLSSEQRWREVNHLLLSAQERQTGVLRKNLREDPSRTSSVPDFLKEMGVTESQIDAEQDLVFVLTPFDKEFESDFFAIKTTCEAVGLRCVRGDEEQASGDIFTHILKLIAKAGFVIANISSRNPNVYYELGIAQTLGKPAILVARDKAGLTFDLQSQRVVLYEDRDDLSNKLKDMLLRTVLHRRRAAGSKLGA